MGSDSRKASGGFKQGGSRGFVTGSHSRCHWMEPSGQWEMSRAAVRRLWQAVSQVTDDVIGPDVMESRIDGGFSSVDRH